MDCHQYYGRKKNRQDCYNQVELAEKVQFRHCERKCSVNPVSLQGMKSRSNLNLLPLPTGERIEVRGKMRNKERGFE